MMVYLVNKAHQDHGEPLEHLDNQDEMAYLDNRVVQVFQDLRDHADLSVHQGTPGKQDHLEEQGHLELLVRCLQSFQ